MRDKRVLFMVSFFLFSLCVSVSLIHDRIDYSK